MRLESYNMRFDSYRVIYNLSGAQTALLYFYIPFPCRRREPPWCYRRLMGSREVGSAKCL